MAQRPNIDDKRISQEEFDAIVVVAISRGVVREDGTSPRLPFCLMLDDLFERIYDAAVELTSGR